LRPAFELDLIFKVPGYNVVASTMYVNFKYCDTI
jgi:hypothetical protein